MRVLLTLLASLWLSQMSAQHTSMVFAPTDSTDHYANGVVMTAFHDTIYCMWQSSPRDEDSDDTWVAYSISCDEGLTWSKPMPLAMPNDTAYCTSGGWRVEGNTLIAFIDIWPKASKPRGGYTYYMESSDGRTWSVPKTVTMKDGSPMRGVLEQDPCRLTIRQQQGPHPTTNDRLIGACHFQPGLHVCPVYTDDTSGRSGWQQGAFNGEDRGDQSRCLEPSQYVAADGTVVMVFRDQVSTFRKMMAYSHDMGLSWTAPVVTEMLDGRTKQCAGNLPDSTAFMVSCPSGKKQRWPLVLQLSPDGKTFDREIILRDEQDLPERRYEGKAKTIGYSYPKAFVYGEYLYIGYSVNKESVACTRVPIDICKLQK